MSLSRVTFRFPSIPYGNRGKPVIPFFLLNTKYSTLICTIMEYIHPLNLYYPRLTSSSTPNPLLEYPECQSIPIHHIRPLYLSSSRGELPREQSEANGIRPATSSFLLSFQNLQSPPRLYQLRPTFIGRPHFIDSSNSLNVHPFKYRIKSSYLRHSQYHFIGRSQKKRGKDSRQHSDNAIRNSPKQINTQPFIKTSPCLFM